jgi:hypothetical protein
LQHLNRMCSRIRVHIKHRGMEHVGQLINLRLIEIILYKNLNRLGRAELFEIGDIDPPILVKIMPQLFQCLQCDTIVCGTTWIIRIVHKSAFGL